MKKTTLIFGRHPVLDAIREGQTFDKIVLQQGTRGDLEREVRRLCKVHSIPLQYIPKERMNKMVRGNHQGLIGFVSLLKYYKLEDVLPHVYEQGEVPLFVLLDGVTDVRNFGAIARSAEICGAHALIIPQKGGAQINADAMKTSAGALTTLPVCRETSLMAAVQYLQLNGIQVLASDLQEAKPIYEYDFSIPTAIVVGSEGAGISRPILNQVQDRFKIPQVGKTDSFNVSVATGIALYEVVRQRVNS